MGLFGPPNVIKLAARKNVKGLIKALAYQKGGDVQAQAAKALGQIGDARAVEPLIAALEEYGSLREEAVKALGQIGDARAVEPIIYVLKYSSESWQSSLRIAAVDALGKIGDARADEPLIDILTDPKLAPESLERKTVAKALLKSGRMTIEQIDEISKPFVAQYRADMEAIVEKYEAMVDKARASRPGIPYTKIPKRVEPLYEKYKSESVEFLSRMLFNSSKSDDEHIACCLALGKIATVQAREELGSVFSRQFHRHDGALVSHGGAVCGIAIEVLKRLGPPAPESLIEAIAAPHLFRESEQMVVDELLVAIGGSDLDEKLTDFLKRHDSSENRSRTSREKIKNRIRQIKVKLAIARREMYEDL